MAVVVVTADTLGELEPLRPALEASPWEVRLVASRAAAVGALRGMVDVVLCALGAPGPEESPLLEVVRRRSPDTVRVALLPGCGCEPETPPSSAHLIVAAGDPGALARALERAIRLRADLEGERVRSEVAGLDSLLTPPTTIARLLHALDSPGCSAGSVAGVLERDVGLATKILQVANSPFFAPRSGVVSLELAVARLGAQTVRSLALMDGFARNFERSDRVLRAWLALFNAHSMETARLAAQLTAPAQRPDAFCGGLLHEVGQLVFASCRTEVFTALLRLPTVAARLPADRERTAFGVDHAAAGAYLLGLWGFPAPVVAAARGHLAPPTSEGPLGAPEAVRLAHHLIERERVPLCEAPHLSPVDDEVIARAGVVGDVWTWRAELAANDAARPPNLLAR